MVDNNKQPNASSSKPKSRLNTNIVLIAVLVILVAAILIYSVYTQQSKAGGSAPSTAKNYSNANVPAQPANIPSGIFNAIPNGSQSPPPAPP